MKKSDKLTVVAVGSVLALVAFGACAKTAGGNKDESSKATVSSVTTNDNGSVSRTFTESTVTTNGNMVTEHRRETRTNLDMEGNVLETSTSEYAQSYPVGDQGVGKLPSINDRNKPTEKGGTANAESFLGLMFGEVFSSTNFVQDANDPDYLRATFKPTKPLDGFDDFYVYVTPKTHKVAKVYACAKDAIEPGTRWKRHYLIEALEKRFNTWARLSSWCRPRYSFDIGEGRHLILCLAGATPDYETVIAAWDDDVGTEAAEEREQLREEARKSAAEKRGRRVSAAIDAF